MPLPFLLRKAYIDAIDPQAAWWIGYDAALKWGALRVNYREVSSPAGRSARTTLSRRDVDSGAIDLSPRAGLRLEGGNVSGPEICLQTRLFEWRLTHRRADFVVTMPGGTRRIPSAGYGEIVTLFRPPWDLGISDLYWGRYMSELHFVVWIVTTGEHPIAFGVVGDDSSQSAHLGAGGIRIGGTTVSLDTIKSTISQGDAIGDRAWPARALVRSIAPRFSVTQRKAIYSSTLHLPDGSREKGLAIAEHVSFRRRAD
jgi:hypothetical protein